MTEQKITQEIFDHLVDLAALTLNQQEAEYLCRELNEQMGPIRELEAIEVDESLPITSHGVPYTPSSSPRLREDTVRPYRHPDEILQQAPEQEDGYVVVPDLPSEELE